MAADTGVPDTPFRDKPPGKPGLSTERFGRLLKRQEPVSSKVHMSYRFSFGWLVYCQATIDA